MTATVLDDRRRVVMPQGLPARSAVTIQQVDEDTWIVKRQRENPGLLVVAFNNVKSLPKDAAWEKTESAFAAHAAQSLTPYEE